jgi:methionyl-tRNA formyltransferase
MRIVFFGSSQFAVPSLKALITGDQKISCVITQPDRFKGRGLHLEGTAVKEVAKDYKLRIFQPEKINTNEAINFIKTLDSDLFVVVSYGQILSNDILNLPKIFALNAHASILPKYRGAAPINWAIINGEQATGVTIIKMIKEMDAGPIILQKQICIKDEDTSITLAERLSILAAELLIGSLKQIKNNDFKLTPQLKVAVTLAPKLKKEDGLIDWDDSAQNIYNLVRGCLSWPGAFTYCKGKLLKIYKARVIKALGDQANKTPGEVIEVSKHEIIVACARDNLSIEELQIEGKRRVKTEEFLAGHKVISGEKLGISAGIG